jgi:hypothetical protein
MDQRASFVFLKIELTEERLFLQRFKYGMSAEE